METLVHVPPGGWADGVDRLWPLMDAGHLENRTSREHFVPADSPLCASFRRATGEVDAHAHHDYLKIAVVTEGTGLHITSGETVAFVPGSVFILRPGSWHWYASCHNMLVGHCSISVEALHREFAFIRNIPDVQRLLWTGPMGAGRHGVLSTSVSPPVARRAFGEIMALRNQLASGCTNQTLLAARLLTIVGTLAEDPDLAPFTDVAPPGVAKTVRLLEANPERPWTIDDLAAEANLAPSYFSRLFREHVGLPPLAYLARLRVERASVLLARSDLSVSQVGMAVGWSDPNYFARRFRTLSGTAPRDYRHQVRRGHDGGIPPEQHTTSTRAASIKEASSLD